MTRKKKVALASLIGIPLMMAVIWLIAGLGWIGVVLEIAAIGVGVAARRAVLEGRLFADSCVEGRTEIAEVTLPSATSTPLVLSAVVQWSSGAGTRPRDAELAAVAVLDRAAELTAQYQPMQASLAERRLAAHLAIPAPDATGELMVWASDLRLSLTGADQRGLELEAAARRDSAVWEIRTAQEKRIRDYLHNDALATPASAIGWWLSRNEAAVEQAVGLSEVLSRLSGLVNGIESEHETGDIARLVEAVSRLEPESRRRTAADLAVVFERMGWQSEAETLRHEFRVPALRPVNEWSGME